MKETFPDPPEVRRAAYLLETGRLDQLKAEGLEHFVASPRPAPGGQVILVNGQVAYHSARPGSKAEQLDNFYRRWKRIQLKAKKGK